MFYLLIYSRQLFLQLIILINQTMILPFQMPHQPRHPITLYGHLRLLLFQLLTIYIYGIILFQYSFILLIQIVNLNDQVI